MNDVWSERLKPARERELARLERQYDSLINSDWFLGHYVNGKLVSEPDVSKVVDDHLRRVNWYEREIAWVKRPEWMPERLGRRMPSLWGIVTYWADLGTFGEIDLVHGDPYCFRCESIVPIDDDETTTKQNWEQEACHWLERAHLVTRIFGGLDGPQNLVPLCKKCHREMPDFDIDEDSDALFWVMEGRPDD